MALDGEEGRFCYLIHVLGPNGIRLLRDLLIEEVSIRAQWEKNLRSIGKHKGVVGA